MKKLFAIATATALLAGGSAFAADSSSVRLSDHEMDGVSAGFLNFNTAIIGQSNTNTSPAVAIGGGGFFLSGNAVAVTVNDQSNRVRIRQRIN